MVTKPISYTVKSGDSLSKIAAALFGDYKLWPVLVEYNPQIVNPNMITPGMILNLPPYNLDTGEYILDHAAASAMAKAFTEASKSLPVVQYSTPADSSGFDYSSWLKDPKKLALIGAAGVVLVLLLTPPARARPPVPASA